ncbi:MAG: ATP-binding cassette domain-containing protein [Pseudomonadota bacterium]
MAAPQLEVRALDKNYGSVHALKSFDLTVNKGEVIGLIGDNGAGKSTFIKILSGVHRPTSGAMLFDGKPQRLRSPRDAMALGIETIYQQTAMVPSMSIMRNMFIGRELRTAGPRGFGYLDVKRMGREAVAAIADVGLHLRHPETLVRDLSGGQRQGVAIARAMHFRSRILILDEPTNHLSVKETLKVLEYVERAKAQSITCIFISHNLHHVEQVADRIVAMARGRKVADQPVHELSVDRMIDLIG